ncbi:hypothetical protein ACE1OC_15895 [Streptomyces sp. DSM 116496]|uniref:hypothetical protein n=1 Tax=Streptomyces stoeckheimensis TaxID=3344656 RepID=UPI0038B32817
MRTALALRTSITTAALAGAMLLPAAGSAFAAPVTSAPQAAAASECRVGPKNQPLGAGIRADLYFGSSGPEAFLFEGGDERGFARLEINEPSLPKSQGIIVRILNPRSAAPVLEWKTQGGANAAFGRASFPKLPKGCKPNYELTETKPAPKPTTPAQAKPKPQTVVVPKGPVAAGAELGTETTGNAGAPIAVAGAGVLSVGLLLGAAFAVRARRARSRG